MKSDLREFVVPTIRFPKLPLLDSVVQTCGKSGDLLEDTAIIAVQHLLETTGSLFEALFSLGLDPRRTFVLGKLYSTNSAVEDDLRHLGIHVLQPSQQFPWGGFSSQFRSDVRGLWSYSASRIPDAVRKVLVLDDGGFALATVPEEIRRRFKVAGVEQTTSGLTANRDQFRCPVVEVASSAVKRILEAPIIREAVLKRVQEVLKPTKGIGVVGLGSVGGAIARHLIEIGHEVNVFDPFIGNRHDPRIRVTHSLSELLTRSDQVFGCAGADIFSDDDSWRDATGPTSFYSCSSHDVEFKTILQTLNDNPRFETLDRFADLTLRSDGSSVQIVRGGFPVNFDGTRESAPASQIQLTRALLVAALIQAHEVARQGGDLAHGGHMVHPDVQKKIALEFLSLGNSPDMFPSYCSHFFSDTAWIHAQSGGAGIEVVS